MTKKNKYFTLAAIALAIVISCVALHRYRPFSRYSPEIETVLQLAGSNRGELEKVLKHYGKNPADSLKLRAAEFLIVNMPGKYSEYYDAPWNDVSSVFFRWTSSSNKDLLLDVYGLDEMVKKYDVTHITAHYLIDNIELAFEVWLSQPWGKDVSFDLFCEEILPYRVNTEPLENWRAKALASFADLYVEFVENKNITSVQACKRINSRLPNFKIDMDYPPMNFSQLIATNRSPCEGMAALAVFAMRALGIPVSIDFTPAWPVRNNGHTWNSVYDTKNDRHISFMGTESAPGVTHQGITNDHSKIYRRTFAIQNHFGANNEDVPPELRHSDAIDVTREYGQCMNIDIAVHFKPDRPVEYAYLATIGETEWNLVGWGSVNDESIKFRAVGKKMLYLPVFYIDGEQSPSAYPFILNNDRSIHYLEPNLNQINLITINRLNPPSSGWTTRMQQGKFEGANRSDFSDAQILHTIKEVPSFRFNPVTVNRGERFRYVRYVSPIGGSCNVAEIEFYGDDNKKLQGTVIGTPGSYGNSSNTIDKVFDGNINTFYDAAERDNAWVGLDLGKPVNIRKIRFHPRTDDNALFKENQYELFYWDGMDWQSLGQYTPDDESLLHCYAPQNALFHLKETGDKSRKTVRVFMYQNGQQKWL
jgi:hypothetical protein